MNALTVAATPSLAAAAHWYAKRGLPVLPCRPREKIPASPHGTRDATCDLATIGTWWQERPDCNVAIATGRGIFALDIDGPEGEAALSELEQRHGLLPPTAESTTGRGRHLLFRHPEHMTIANSASKIAPGMDVRGEGGCVVAPPIHPNGRRYLWREGRRIDLVEIAAAPDWLLTLVSKPEVPAPASADRSPDRISAYAARALADEIAAVASAAPGARNETLNRAAFALGQLVGSDSLERATVERGLTGAALAAGLDKVEIDRTIRSGIDAGMKEPRDLPATMATPRSEAAIEPGSSAPWPELDGAALHGFVGDLVATIGPHTEADPVALIAQFLAAFGSAVGRAPHFMAEADRHGGNLFAVLVAETAKGRKGTSWGHVNRLVMTADTTWHDRVVSGLSSGEGLIYAVRDPIEKAKGDAIDIVDAGVADKRLFVIEGEFAAVLKVAMREGNTLSAVIRNAWDGAPLRTLTRNSPMVSTDPHVAIVGHITREELIRHLTATEAGNGFGNRFLWLAVRRSKLLPEGGSPDRAAMERLSDRLRTIIGRVRTFGDLRRDEEAREVWHAVYRDLSDGKPGLLGAMIARAEAQTMRLAMLYALLDESPVIGRVHLEAALALWSYAEQSARFIFGDRMGDHVGDAIMDALRTAPDGLTRTDIYNLFGRHKSGELIGQRLATLHGRGLVRSDMRQTGGKPAEVWKVNR